MVTFTKLIATLAVVFGSFFIASAVEKNNASEVKETLEATTEITSGVNTSGLYTWYAVADDATGTTWHWVNMKPTNLECQTGTPACEISTDIPGTPPINGFPTIYQVESETNTVYGPLP